MAYRLSPRLFIENGPAVKAAQTAAVRRTSHAYLAWKQLDPERRMALVEQALAPANDESRPLGLAL